MEFLNALIYKIKSNHFLLLIFILIVVINDAILINYFFNSNKNNDVEKKVVVENSKKEENHDDNRFKIDIKGKVKKPGVYEVDSSMNVNDAIKLAGGIKNGATTLNLNLSKKLEEEMVIVVSSREKVKKNTVSTTNEEVKNDAIITNEEKALIDTVSSKNIGYESLNLVNINSANLDQLLTLSGIGESKAKAIMSYREKTIFESIDDIKNVPGIGDSLFEKIKDSITV